MMHHLQKYAITNFLMEALVHIYKLKPLLNKSNK